MTRYLDPRASLHSGATRVTQRLKVCITYPANMLQPLLCRGGVSREDTLGIAAEVRSTEYGIL